MAGSYFSAPTQLHSARDRLRRPAVPAARPKARLEVNTKPDPDHALAQLVKKASDGDRASIEALVRELGPAIAGAIGQRLRVANAMGRLSSFNQQVEDLSQEVLLGLFADQARRLKQWDRARGLSLQRFVALIADRHAISYLRRLRPVDYPAVATDHHPGIDTVASPDNPQQWLENRQTLSLLMAAIGERLSPLGQQLFHLLYVQQLTVSETCDAAGMSADAVYAWRSRLRRQLKALLLLIQTPTPTHFEDNAS